ncbi:MAG: type III pantothenate kinase [Bacteroidia bacterium]
MIWTIDAGNTLIKWGLWNEDGCLVTVLRSPLNRVHETLQEALGLGKPRRTAISSVSLPRNLWEELWLSSGLPPAFWPEGPVPWPFESSYRTPETLGLDRKIQMTGAMALHPGLSWMVLGLGTCLTVDWLVTSLDHKVARHMGGLISPGLRMRYRALNRETAALPSLEPGFSPSPYPGLSTVEAIHAGAGGGWMAEIQHHVRLWGEAHPRAGVMVCGGDATPEVVAQIRHDGPIFAEPNLALHGLYALLHHASPLL